MRRVVPCLVVPLSLMSLAWPAEAQFRWRDDGTPEMIGRRAPSAPWGRDGGRLGMERPQPPRSAQRWDDPPWAFAPPPGFAPSPRGQGYAGPAPRIAPADEVRDGGPRPEIAPVAPPIVHFTHAYAAGSIVIDSEGRRLYYVLPGRQAYAYVISVGREGFDWFGSETVSRKQAWPDWHPPAEMRQRDPGLPVKMMGGVNNPLGAMALYLGTTLYRIHGTNDERTLGQAGSSGCFRMLNANVLHLASLADVGTTVHVVRALEPARVAGAPRGMPPPSPQAVPLAPAQRTGPPPRVRRDLWPEPEWQRFPDTRRDRPYGWRW